MFPSKRSLTYGIFVKNQVESLKKRGFSVEVVAISDPRVGKLRAILKYGKWALKGLATVLFKGKKYDVVHAHYVFPTGIIGLLYKKIFKKPFFVTAHGGDIDRMAKRNARMFNWTKKVLENADQIIAVGEQLKEDIVKDFSIEDGKVSVLNMGVDRQIFHPIDKKVAAAELGLNPQDFHILFVGNFIKAKGLEELAAAFLEVCHHHEHVHLHLIGSKKDGAFYEHLLALFGDKVGQRIHFYSAKPQKELAKWMSAANLFVLPSHIEGFGLVALEAMSCGTPVIGTAVGGLKHLLEDGYGILVPPKNVAGLADAIKNCVDFENITENLIKKGVEKAEANSEEKMISALCQIYSENIRARLSD